MAFKYNRLDKDNVALLMVDHQSGLLSLVRDFSPDEFKNNVLALADFFQSQGLFATAFRKVTGMTPSNYRALIR